MREKESHLLYEANVCPHNVKAASPTGQGQCRGGEYNTDGMHRLPEEVGRAQVSKIGCPEPTTAGSGN